MSYETALYIRVVGETAVQDAENTRIYYLHGGDIPDFNEVVVYDGGVVVDSANYVMGSFGTYSTVYFGEGVVSGTITCDYRWKYECSEREDPVVYEVEKELNVAVMKDVNGRTMLVESKVKTTGWRGVIVWDYMSQAFWDEVRILVENNGYTFDVERSSLDAPLDIIENLYPVSYPTFKESPGTPGLTQVRLEAVQIEV